MGLVAIDLHALSHLHQFTIHTGIEIALLADALEEFTVMSFAALHHGCQKVDALSVVLLQEEVQYVLLGVFDHLLACLIAERLAGSGVEQTQIVIDLCDGADGGTWILVCCLLLDADDRRESADLIDIGTFHATQEITDISAEGLNVASLTFSENGVECQR